MPLQTAAPVLESVGTAVPGEAVLQSTMRAKAEEVLAALAPELLDKMGVFETVGIRKRHFVRPLDWYLETKGWEQRSAAYADAGLDLVQQAAEDALARADVGPEAVDGIVLVSTTGVATPSLDARLLNRMPFRNDVQRVPVWGLGCAGGISGLALTTRLARAHPDKRFLLVSMEACSLAFQMTDLSVRAFVATTLFADGAAAALVRGADLEGPGLARLGAATSHTWNDSEDVMGWEVTDEGLRVVFSRRIPDIVQTRFAPVVDRLLKENDANGGNGGATPDRYVLHPGGTKVLDAYEDALKLPPSALDVSRTVLREYGNMSSPTVLFVLKETLERAPLAKGETALLAALGPGFTADASLLHG